MGFPMEIPNAFPQRDPVPVQNPISLLLQWVADRVLAPFRRRKRRASHRPQAYAQGVPTHLPKIEAGASRHLDFEVIEDPRSMQGGVE